MINLDSLFYSGDSHFKSNFGMRLVLLEGHSKEEAMVAATITLGIGTFVSAYITTEWIADQNVKI